MMIIYKTTNLINNKIYVGQDSKNNPTYLGSGSYIKRAIRKYGKENFKKEILCECFSIEELNKKEIHWIKELDCKVPNGYNISLGGGETIVSEETKIKLKKPKGPMSEEAKIKMKKPKSATHKEKIKLSLNTPKIQEKRRNSMIGKNKGPMSKEARRNMKLSQQKRRERERKHNAKRWGN